MSRAGVLNQIDTRLATITDPAFVAVLRGEPLAIAGTPLLAFWVSGRSLTAQSFTNDGSTTRITIRAYFRMQTSTDVRESIELDVWDAMYSVHNALAGDSELGGNCSDLRIESAEAGFIEMSGSAFRTVSIPIEVDILEEVTVVP